MKLKALISFTADVLLHLRLASFLWDMGRSGKRVPKPVIIVLTSYMYVYSHTCDAAKHCVPSGATLFT